MPKKDPPHKLAAVLYADVAGYSRLTADDEAGTHRHLGERLDAFAASVKRHRGRVMHYAGDAILAKFNAVELSPHEWVTQRNLAWVLRRPGDTDGARDALQRGIELSPDRAIVRRWAAYLAAARGDTAEALEEIRIAERLLGDERPRLALAEIAKVYGQLGQADDAGRLFNEIMSAGDPEHLGTGTLAAAYLAIGDTERSLASLRAAAAKARRHEPDSGFWSLMHLVRDVTAHPALARPEFVEALSEIRGD